MENMRAETGGVEVRKGMCRTLKIILKTVTVYSAYEIKDIIYP